MEEMWFDPQYPAGPIFMPDGSASAPSLTFAEDTDTGIYRVTTNNIGFATNGTLHWKISQSGNLSNESGTGEMYHQDGTVALPAYSFASDIDTGIYRPGANSIGFAAGGSSVFTADSNGITLQGTSKILASSGNDIWLDASAGDDLLFTAGDDIIFFYTPGGVPTEVMRIDEGNTRIQFSIITNFNATMGNSTKDPTTDAPVDWVEVQIGGVTHYLPAYAA